MYILHVFCKGERGLCYSRREKFCFETNGQVHVTVRCDKYQLLLHLPAREPGQGLRKSLATRLLVGPVS